MVKKTTETAVVSEAAAEEVVTAIKGFNKDWTCRGFQYAIGETYKHDGHVEACRAGFHAIEGNPFEVFWYYPAATSVFADVDQRGSLCRHDDDSKIASAEITIKAEVALPEIIRRGIDFVFAKVKAMKADQTSSGDRSTAATSGDRSTAATSGYQSTAATSGDRSTAATSGDRSTAATSGDASSSMATGEDVRVRADKDGCVLCIHEIRWNGSTYAHFDAAFGVTGKDGIKAGVLYRCEGGKLIPAEAA
ncbi:DUF7666 domain-containing protein [Jiella avicenniae]|uniref:DUF7666 domain-containing protein n=1 Tax=Jiella avicenniae TaxID=2907202 RepID=A0A9X1TBW0_9HYPH|nr:hypothetical protein [Jiella avicenniae]MCE7028438.1 hypothetical protein [Jiella avicenniae]